MSNVDVVIPCYNYARYLDQCVQSILTQRDVNVRILIVDDKSSDDTPAACARLAASDPRVSYKRNEDNLGLIGTANVGIMGWATAEYYTLISADDALVPGSLARATQVLNAHPEAGLLIGSALIIDDTTPPKALPDASAARYQIISGDAFLKRNFEAGNPAPSPSVVLRTHMQHELGGYHPAMRHTSDMEMWMRFAIHGPIALVKDIQALYRWHGANMTLGFDIIRDREERLKACDATYQAGGANNPRFVEMLTAMKRRFAHEAYWYAGDALEAGNPDQTKRGLAFAQQCDPNIRSKPIALRFQVKRLLGPALSKRVRGAVKEAKRALGENAGAWFAPNSELGWWPTREELGEAPLAEGLCEPGAATDRPKLSFIVCTRNRAAMLPGCLQSLETAALSRPDIGAEVVVVDNGSGDNTADVVKQFASAAEIPVRLVSEPKAGLAIARNAGVAAARGDIVAFTDDDCRVEHDYVSQLIKAYAPHTEPVIIGGRVELGDARDLPMTIKTEKEPAVFDGEDAGAFVIGSNLTMSRAAWAKVGEMDTRLGAGTPLKASEETDYIHRAYLAGIAVHYTPDMCVYHFHGRRTAPEVKKLWRGYSIGNGALYAKYFGTPYMRSFRWNLKNAVKEAFNLTKLHPEMGMTYRDMVLGNIEGMALYWWGNLRRKRD